jgi:hypothetical protein
VCLYHFYAGLSPQIENDRGCKSLRFSKVGLLQRFSDGGIDITTIWNHCHDKLAVKKKILEIVGSLFTLQDFGLWESHILRFSRIFETWKIPNNFIVLQISLNGSNVLFWLFWEINGDKVATNTNWFFKLGDN